MANFREYNFDGRIEKAYSELLGQDKKINTNNDSSSLGNEMAWLEQSLKETITTPHYIDRVGFDNFQRLVTRIGWLHNNPKKFDDKEELAQLNNYFTEWLNNAYKLFDKEQG